MNPTIKSLLAILVILAAAGSISWGLWNAPVSRADETVYIQTAQLLATKSQVSLNPFFDFYAALFRFVTKDPIVAHLTVRFVNTLLSSLALYYLLTAFRFWLKETALLAATLVWISSYLCTPLTQMGNVSLFAASLAMFGIGIALRDPGVGRGLLALCVLTLGALVRKELWMGWILLTALMTLRYFFAWRNHRLSLPPLLAFILVAACLFLGSLKARHRAQEILQLSGPNEHAMLAFRQSYGGYTKRENTDATFDPMTEFTPAFERAFGKAATLPQVISANPKEAFTYFLHNSLNNLKSLPSCFLSTRDAGKSQPLAQRLQSLLLMLCLIAGGAMIAFAAFHLLRRHHWRLFQSLQAIPHADQLGWRLAVLIALAASSTVAFVMVIFVSRHYLPVMPLVFLLIATCVDHVLRLPGIRRIPAPIIVVIFAVAFCRPLSAFSERDWNEELRVIRELKNTLPSEPMIAGISAHPYIVYCFDGRGRQATPMTNPKLNAQDLRAGHYDLFVINGNLKGTTVWNQDRPYFEGFVKNPEASYYRLYRNVRNGAYLIYVKQN